MTPATDSQLAYARRLLTFQTEWLESIAQYSYAPFVQEMKQVLRIDGSLTALPVETRLRIATGMIEELGAAIDRGARTQVSGIISALERGGLVGAWEWIHGATPKHPAIPQARLPKHRPETAARCAELLNSITGEQTFVAGIAENARWGTLAIVEAAHVSA